MQANSLEELANVMGLAPEAIETFLATVKRYNELVDAGDTDSATTRAYGEDRAASLLRPAHERGTGSERQRPHHKRRLRVPHRSGRSHPRAVCVGNNAGGLFGIDYNEVTIPGISLGRCVTFGWLLGQHLAK